MKSLRPFVLAGLAAFSGCRIEKPSTVVPAPPSVETFTVSKTNVTAGAEVTLSWKTANATEVEVREASTGELPVPEGTLEGTFSVTVTTNSLFVLVARGAGGADARALSVSVDATGVGEVTFQAIPPSSGTGATTLVWTAPGARTVTITAGAVPLNIAGQLSAGAVSVQPEQDTTYTLTADGVVRTVTVAVQPALLSAAASPIAVQVGQAITLSWATIGADRVVVSSAGRGVLLTVTDAARVKSGTFDDVAPALPGNSVIAYEIAAFKGTTREARSLEVNVGTGLRIVRFDAPAVAAAGLTYSVRWQTLAADSVVVKVDGVTVHQSTATQAASGQFSFIAPAQDFAVELTASNVRGDVVRQLSQVDAVGIPTTATLTAQPASVAAGSAVTLVWACPEARRMRIVDGQGRAVFSVNGQLAEAGMVTAYPNADTLYTLTADNQLGDPAVTATAPVTVTGTPLRLTQFPPTPLTGQKVDLSVGPSALFFGFAHDQVLRSSQADFIDIIGTGQRVLEEGGSVASVDLPFAVWLFGTRQSGSLTISRAGWIAWGAPLVVTTSNVALPSSAATTPPFLIAPFWGDLQLTPNSSVLAQLVGNAPDQSLVVQWERVRVGSSVGSELTFQVRVHQDGMVSFHYKTMTYASSTPTFTLGLQDGTKRVAVSGGTVSPVSGTATYFFSPVPSATVRAAKGGRVGGVVEVAGVRTLVTRPSSAVEVPTDLAISEVMFRPAATVTNGQFLEVVNRTDAGLDLTGWSLRSGTTSFSVANGFSLAPGPFLVGGSTNPVENDDAGVALSWGSFALNRDAGQIIIGTADAGATLDYAGPADGGEGASLEYDLTPNLLVRSTATTLPSFLATRTFGGQTPLQRGSPGALTSSMTVQAIPSAYVDISSTGTRLINSATAVDGQTVTITLAALGSDPAPVAFGVRQPVVSMSLDGWMVWGATTSVSFSNKTRPTSSAPLGTIAPFWDDLQTVASSPADMYWKRFDANEDPVTPARHWVFSWHQVRHYNTSPADNLNYEVKLFENGTIEYHYGAMTSGTTLNYGDGNSATVWLEDPTGSFALPLSVNQPVVAPNTAWRFVTQ